MIETHFNAFDATVVGIMVLSCLFAFFRGFVKEILSLGAWIGAGLVTMYYFPGVAAKLQPQFKNPTVAAGFATLGLYIISLLGFSLINMLILKFFKQGNDVGVLDNLVGLLFGAFRGAFVLSLGFFLMTIFIPDEEEYPEWLKKAQTLKYVEHGAVMLGSVAPDYLTEISSLEEKAAEMRKARQDGETSYGTQSTRPLREAIEHKEQSE